MSHEPSFIRYLLERRIELSQPLRVVLSLVLLAGGSALLFIGVALLVRPVSPPLPAAAATVASFMAAFGCGILWLGLRLLRARAASAILLGDVARRRISLIVGLLAVCSFAFAVQIRSAECVLLSAWLVAFSYFLFPVEG